MSIISKDTPPGMGVEIHGPFAPESYLTLDGYRVPHLTVNPCQDGRFDISVDNRFCLHEAVTAQELDNWLPILANAMAVAAGYSCHGEHCRPLADMKFKTQMTALNSISPKSNLTVIDGDKI